MIRRRLLRRRRHARRVARQSPRRIVPRRRRPGRRDQAHQQDRARPRRCHPRHAERAAPDVRALLNRLGAWTQMLEAMRKLEKDTPGILEQHKKQIDIGEVEEGVTRLSSRSSAGCRCCRPARCRPSPASPNPQDIRDELEKEIADVLGPIRECEWIPLDQRSQIPDVTASPPTPEPLCEKDRSSGKSPQSASAANEQRRAAGGFSVKRAGKNETRAHLVHARAPSAPPSSSAKR
jgi:hypothetical protein